MCSRPTFVSFSALLTMAVLCGLQADAQQAAESDMRLGAAAMQARHYEEAEHDFRKVVAAAPDYAEGHLNLGLALLREAHLPEALASFEKAAQLAPKLPGPHMFLAIAYFESGRLDAAKKAVDGELALTPDNVEALTLAGTVAMAMDDPESAVPPLDRASRLSPDDLDLLDLRGRAYQAVAKNIYQRMYQLAPDSWQVHQARARLYDDDQRYKEAADEYEAASRANPQDLNLYDQLALEYRHVGNLDAVERTFVREKSVAPDDPRALLNLGSVQIERGRASEGLPLVKQALAMEPGNTRAYYYLGRGLADTGNNADAVAALQKYLAMEPQGDLREQAYYTLARLYRNLQKPEEARKALGEFQRLKQERDAHEKQQVDAFRKQ
jgi:tetratricopeptide (TPR) repeat protein